MKNFLKFAIPLIIGFIIGYYFCSYQGGDPTNVNSNPPEGIISVKQAIDLHNNYTGERYQMLNNYLGEQSNIEFEDTQFVWFSMDKLEAYLDYLHVAEQQNPNNPEFSGIRVYFGANERAHRFSDQQTVFFTPTIDVKLDDPFLSMNHLPVSILPDNTENPLMGRYVPIRELMLDYRSQQRSTRAERFLRAKNDKPNTDNQKKSGQITSNGNAEKGLTSLNFNEGELAPPPKNGDQ